MACGSKTAGKTKRERPLSPEEQGRKDLGVVTQEEMSERVQKLLTSHMYDRQALRAYVAKLEEHLGNAIVDADATGRISSEEVSHRINTIRTLVLAIANSDMELTVDACHHVFTTFLAVLGTQTLSAEAKMLLSQDLAWSANQVRVAAMHHVVQEVLDPLSPTQAN